MTGPKKKKSARQKYAFSYWRRGFRRLGMSLDRLALRNGIQYIVSGHNVHITTLDPGKVLSRMRDAG